MIQIRLITAFLLLPLILWPLVAGYHYAWMVMVAAFAALSVYELTAMIFPALSRRLSLEASLPPSLHDRREKLWALLLLASTQGLLAVLIWLPWNVLQLVLVGLGLWFFVLPFLLQRSVEDALTKLLVGLLTVSYGTLPWLFVWALYNKAPHGYHVLFLIAVVMGSDTGGYLGGRLFGKTPFSPILSPNKTWEGALMACLFALLISGALNLLLNLYPWPLWLLLSLLGAAATMTGDLMECALKRFAQVKDSAKILPGHGGFLDRVDGFLFVAPLFWFILSIWHHA